jgi:S-DNA-T family DNA segregation ATPase FtsK/SpoIIIE
LAGLLFLAALGCLALLLQGLAFWPEDPAGEAGGTGSLGVFFFSLFDYGAFYLPLYLGACGILLLRRRVSAVSFGVLVGSLLPFVTLCLFLKLIGPSLPSRGEMLITQLFGRPGGGFFLLVLLAAECFVLMRLALLDGETGDLPDRPGPPAAAAEPLSLTALFRRGLSHPLEAGPLGEEAPEEDDPQEEAPEEGTLEEGTPEEGEASPAAPEGAEPEPHPAPEERDPEEDLEEDPEADSEELFPRGPESPEEPEGFEEPRDSEEPGDSEEPEEPAPPLSAPAAASGEGGKKAPPRKRKYALTVSGILDDYPDGQYWIIDGPTQKAAGILRDTLEEFKISAEVTGISKGPVITMFEILPAPGVKLSKITNLADNIALRLAASRVRIVAPIPGKHAVGIEVPNANRSIVSFKEMLATENREARKMQIPVILGKDITGGGRVIDLVQTPHLLIAGATGSGKSVCVNALICSILYTRRPDEVKLIMIDPKIVELKLYNGIPHLLTPVITDSKRAFKALQYAIFEMERRYSLLDALGVREIRSYNAKVEEQKLTAEFLPYIVIVVDEFADLMATTGKELETAIARLTAMSRAVGIHLVLATQRPSVDIITGLIKANIPSRIAFMVASKFDSRIIIDSVGAEKLLGKGDMLFTSAWDPNPARIQGAFLSEKEAERVAGEAKAWGAPDYIDDEIFIDEDDEDFELSADGGDDPLLDTAVGIIVEAGKASASYLQRRLKIGYNRAARLVEEMERRGIIGPAQGSRPREIIHIPDRK